VLEGGYSIETALPYVNTGIIVAMAGLDFSHIREPDYDERQLRQPPEITKYLGKLKEVTFERWNNHRALHDQFYPPQPFHTRSKDIYYDTDGLREHQEETVRTCEDCGGTVVTDSHCSDTRNRILGVTIPLHACDACRQFGEEQFDKAKSGSVYTQVFLQDKERGIYLEK